MAANASIMYCRNFRAIFLSASVRTVERGSFGPVLRSSTVWRFCPFATVFVGGNIPLDRFLILLTPQIPAERRLRSFEPTLGPLAGQPSSLQL